MRKALSPAIRVASLKVRSFICVRLTCSVPSPKPRTYTGRFAVRDDSDVAQAVVQRGHRVADHDDERAAADGGAIDVARRDPERLADGGGRVLTRSKDAVDVRNFQSSITDSICHCVHVEAELALVRKGAHLVGFVDADDAGGVGEIPEIRQRAHPTPRETRKPTPPLRLPHTT